MPLRERRTAHPRASRTRYPSSTRTDCGRGSVGRRPGVCRDQRLLGTRRHVAPRHCQLLAGHRRSKHHRGDGRGATVVLKGTGALLPFDLCRPAPPSKWHGRLRLLAWAEGAVLTLYGFVFTSAGLLVQAGVIHLGRAADRRALVWHTYLWDPWFLVWGLLVVLALALTSAKRTCAARNARQASG